MRILLFVLLSLSLAFNGAAIAGAVDQPCPMAGEMMMESGEHALAADCCNEADTASRTGEPCKTGQGCNVPAGGIIGVLALPQPGCAAVRLLPATVSGVLTLNPSEVWRPPALS